MNEIKLHIMIVDDNPAIHQDFIKVLTTSNSTSVLHDLDEQLFGDEFNSNNYKLDCLSPKFIFETASQGQEGVEKIKQALKNGIQYALAFVDVRMPPGWDGIETIKHMWELDPDIQVVICTAYSDYSWEETVKQLGMGDNYLILKKPFDTVAVRQLASALTKKWILAKDSRHHTKVLEQTVVERTESLQQSLSLLRSTIESSVDGILLIDLKGKIIDCNSSFLSIWNIPHLMIEANNELIMIEFMLSQLRQSKRFLAQLNDINKNINDNSNHVVTFKNGKIVECSSQPHRMNNMTIGRVWSFRDITERAILEKKLEYQASHDMLTGLPNRVLLIDRIQHCLEVAQRDKHQIAILFFDLDRFKLINDSLSHEVGDELLRAVAKRLLEAVRKEDTLARLGGDEFVMIIPQLRMSKSIISVANKILNLFKKSFYIANREIIISTSIGISISPRDGNTVNQLLKNADLAMYRSKEQGGNQFQFYTHQLNEQTNQRFQQETELRIAIEKNQFILCYQPQFDTDKKSLLSAEALIRWQHPEKGLLLPMDFIPIAEESGLIVQIGEWVIREVCRQIKEWSLNGLPLIRVAVNVATQQLKQVNFATTVNEILKEYQLAPEYLEIEITENVVITNTEIIRMVNQLKLIGVRIVLDDFGTGNSSLNYLKRIHIDSLKIDQSFVQNISSSRSDEVIIEAIISMARSFNFRVVAEGVENQKQMNFLKKQNCDEVQGFLLSHPLSPNEIEHFFNHEADENKKHSV